MRILVTGGAGFVGSHLCDALVERGDDVVCLDNLATGTPANVAHLEGHPRFSLLVADVCEPQEWHDTVGPVDAVAHLACPASPQDYFRLALQTLDIGSRGSKSVLALAERWGARVLLASTSEVYGEPQVHPQPEGYWGNVNPIGVRSVYDESKRFAEATFAAHRRERGTDTAIVRIFNTYGPRLRPSDGRVVSNFIAQALAGEALTVYGDGSQTRSFCYVSDLVAGIVAMLGSDLAGPVNLGNPAEMSVADLAATIIDLTGSASTLTHRPLPQDDPTQRRPDITLAAAALGWSPSVGVLDGLAATIAWQREQLATVDVRDHALLATAATAPTTPETTTLEDHRV